MERNLTPLQQWRAGILRLVEHPAIELEPGELTIDVERGGAEVRRRSGRNRMLPRRADGCGGDKLFGHGRKDTLPGKPCREALQIQTSERTYTPMGYY
jgi:hypothetical protein